MITAQNIVRHELIGLPVSVVDASNPTHRGVTGTIIDETRNMVFVETATGLKKIPKRRSIFRLQLPDGTVVDLDGSVLATQPEKRITMRIKR